VSFTISISPVILVQLLRDRIPARAILNKMAGSRLLDLPQTALDALTCCIDSVSFSQLRLTSHAARRLVESRIWRIAVGGEAGAPPAVLAAGVERFPSVSELQIKSFDSEQHAVELEQALEALQPGLVWPSVTLLTLAWHGDAPAAPISPAALARLVALCPNLQELQGLHIALKPPPAGPAAAGSAAGGVDGRALVLDALAGAASLSRLSLSFDPADGCGPEFRNHLTTALRGLKLSHLKVGMTRLPPAGVPDSGPAVPACLAWLPVAVGAAQPPTASKIACMRATCAHRRDFAAGECVPPVDDVCGPAASGRPAAGGCSGGGGTPGPHQP
jgi:hypothetical protein